MHLMRLNEIKSMQLSHSETGIYEKSDTPHEGLGPEEPALFNNFSGNPNECQGSYYHRQDQSPVQSRWMNGCDAI